MVQTAHEKGFIATARLFGTTRNTVRKWLTRYRLHGTPALQDLSKAPRRRPKRIPEALEGKILDIRRRLPTWML